ncbi:19904_t:CDS:2, partial [Entrophospora sp. SA101]
QFPESPNSTFFVPEDTAVNIKPEKAIRTTDPNAFYAYQKKENELGTHISELMIMIDNDEAKHFFKQEELNILNVLKKCKAEYITFKEKMVWC